MNVLVGDGKVADRGAGICGTKISDGGAGRGLVGDGRLVVQVEVHGCCRKGACY